MKSCKFKSYVICLLSHIITKKTSVNAFPPFDRPYKRLGGQEGKVSIDVFDIRPPQCGLALSFAKLRIIWESAKKSVEKIGGKRKK